MADTGYYSYKNIKFPSPHCKELNIEAVGPRDFLKVQGCQIRTDFPPNLATLAASRYGQIGREICPNLATLEL